MTTPKKSKAKRNKNNSTGYHGVTTDSKGNFVAQIFHKGKTIRLGTFKRAIDAARCYDEAATKYHGEKAKLNFPGGKSLLEKAAAAVIE